MQGCHTYFEIRLAWLPLPVVFISFHEHSLAPSPYFKAKDNNPGLMWRLVLLAPEDGDYMPPWFQHVKLSWSFVSFRGSCLHFHTLPCLLPPALKSRMYQLEKIAAKLFPVWSLVKWISSASNFPLIMRTTRKP